MGLCANKEPTLRMALSVADYDQSDASMELFLTVHFGKRRVNF